MLLLTLGGLIVASGAGLFAYMRHALSARFDDGLEARAEALITSTTWEDGVIDFDFDESVLAEYLRADDPEYFQVIAFRDDGSVETVAHAPYMGDAESLTSQIEPVERVIWNLTLPDGRAGRALMRRFRPRFDSSAFSEQPHDPVAELEASRQAPPGPAMAVVLARARDELDAPLRMLALAMLFIGATLAIATIVAVQWVLRRGLRPLEHMATRVGGMDVNNLDQRLHEPHLATELRPLEDRLNELLSRLQSAMQRERRFTTGAAHELRTPVADLRAVLEVACSRPRSQPELEHAMRSALAATVRLSDLVQALLRLSRLGSGSEPVQATIVDLGSMTRNAVREVHAAPQIMPEIKTTGELTARVDEQLFRMALGNLLRNAMEYGDSGAPVAVAVTRCNGMVSIEIENQARGMDGADIARIGEPFWRQSKSRTEQGHLGLGVHLARTIAQAMGGDVVIESEWPGVIRATVSAPFAS